MNKALQKVSYSEYDFHANLLDDFNVIKLPLIIAFLLNYFFDHQTL